MIISASRRTDIPAHYADWFFHRLEAGSVCVRNPVAYHRISRVCLSPDVVDGIVFWTKDPTPMLDRLHLLRDYPYYFQFTLTAYGRDMEPGVASKNDRIIPTFQRLSGMIGPERVIWRYDPILLTPKYTMEYHCHYFDQLAMRLSGYTSKCVISFVDMYRHLSPVSRELQFLPLQTGQILALAEQFSRIAHRYGLGLETCAEGIDLSSFGIGHGCCVDGKRFEQLLGQPLALGRDRNQRAECGCMESVDIGMYDSCGNGCRYCYANHSPATVDRNRQSHDPLSPLLYGTITPEDVVTDRQTSSCKIQQLDFFGKEDTHVSK